MTKRICYGMLQREAEELEHGVETGTIKRLPHGEFIEVHGELTERRRLILDPHPQPTPEETPQVSQPRRRAGIGTGRRSRLTDFFFAREEPVPVERDDPEAEHSHETLHD
jgi:ubiquinol-cytochrome c reductase cytochrome b subunit